MKIYRSGFTLVEMLVTIAVIAILAALLFPALNYAKRKGKSILCISNYRQFGLAFEMYATDHSGLVLPNQDGREMPNGERIPLGLTWVQGWLGHPGHSDVTNTAFLKESLLAPYVNDVKLWRCPSQPLAKLEFDDDVIREGRSRTISLNCFMGYDGLGTYAAKTYLYISEIREPSKRFTFAEERVETINDASFGMQWAFSPDNPLTWMLRDKPTDVHAGGAHFAFADGHVEQKRWEDSRTQDPPRDDVQMPNNLDILWMQKHATSR